MQIKHERKRKIWSNQSKILIEKNNDNNKNTVHNRKVQNKMEIISHLKKIKFNPIIIINKKSIFRSIFLITFYSSFSPLSISSSSVETTSEGPTSADKWPCFSLKMNYSFDFAFNQIISKHNGYRSGDPQMMFHHYIYSQKQFLKLYFDSDSVLQVVPFKFDFKGDDDFLEDFIGDYGFSLRDSQTDLRAKICTAKIKHNHLTCLEVEYRSHLPPTKAFIRNKETFLFDLQGDFRPSLAIQHIGYDHYPTSQAQVILLEQSLRLPTNKTVSNVKRHFDRRWQVYSFERLDRITNLTYSAITPDYLETVPSELEITGVFGWTRKYSNDDEYMIIAFNGTDHLYCLDNLCANIEYYQPFMQECRAPKELISLLNPSSLGGVNNNQGLFVSKCCGQWREFDDNPSNNDDDDGSQWQIRDGKLYRVRSARSTNLNYVIWSLLILAAMVLLLLCCWIYSCISETRYDDDKMKMKILKKLSQSDNNNINNGLNHAHNHGQHLNKNVELVPMSTVNGGDVNVFDDSGKMMMDEPIEPEPKIEPDEDIIDESHNL